MKCPNCGKNFDDELGMCPYCGYVEGETIKKKDKPKCPLWAKIIIPVALVVVAVVSALCFTGVIGGDSGQQTEVPISDETSESMDDEEILNDDDMVADNDSEAEDEAVTEETEETEIKEIEATEIEEKETETTEPEEIEAEIIEEGTCGENLTWTYDENGVLTISGTGEMELYAGLGDIPWHSYRAEIKTILVEEGVTSITGSIFNSYRYLEKVTLPDTLTYIGSCAFQNCSSLTSIIIPESVTYVGDTAFGGWDSNQIVYVKGSTETLAGWNEKWSNSCDATIIDWATMDDSFSEAINSISDEYGVFDSEQSGTITDDEDEKWLDPSGILSASILDLDADGEDELLICRNSWYEEEDGYYAVAEVYEKIDGKVVITSSTVLTGSPDMVVQVPLYEEQTNTVDFMVNAVSMEDGYYLVCEYSYFDADFEAVYNCIWVLEYKSEILQNVCDWYYCYTEDLSSDEPSYIYASCEFKNGVSTQITWYYLEEDEDIFSYLEIDPDIEQLAVYEEDTMDNFFGKYGLIIEYGDAGYEFTGTTSEDTGIALVFDLAIEDLDSSFDDETRVEFESTLLRGNDLLD